MLWGRRLLCLFVVYCDIFPEQFETKWFYFSCFHWVGLFFLLTNHNDITELQVIQLQFNYHPTWHHLPSKLSCPTQGILTFLFLVLRCPLQPETVNSGKVRERQTKELCLFFPLPFQMKGYFESFQEHAHGLLEIKRQSVFSGRKKKRP